MNSPAMKIVREIELRSDTMTKPNAEMRKAMFNAVVGDDGYGEDPTVRELEEYGAAMFGMESALFFPTGIMGNLACVMAHCWERGQEVLLGDKAHIHLFEQGGISQLASVHARTVVNYDDGTFDIDDLQSKIRPYHDIHQPRTAAICLENTHNRCSGAVLPLSFVQQVSNVAKSNNLKLHVDGARICNAAIALDVPVSKVLEGCDTVSVCLSKGLGAPVGSLVAGPREFIKRANRCRKVLGGAMRQSGVVAAPGLVALKTMVNRLRDDHDHAQEIASAISACKSDIISVDVKQVHSNIIMIDVNKKYLSVAQFCDRLRQITEQEKEDMADELCILRVNPFGPKHARIVTHCDLSHDDVLLAINKLRYVIGSLDQHHGISSPLTNNAVA